MMGLRKGEFRGQKPLRTGCSKSKCLRKEKMKPSWDDGVGCFRN